MRPSTSSTSVSLKLAGLCLGLVLLASGCASTGTTTVNQPFTVKLGQYKSATVDVRSNLEKSPEKIEEFKAQLESRIIARLRERNLFDRIYPAAASDSPSDLLISVVLTKVRDVDPSDRIMWGAFAGQAETCANVEVRERASSKLVGAGQIQGKSSGGSVFAGTTPEAVDRVADEVVNLIRNNR